MPSYAILLLSFPLRYITYVWSQGCRVWDWAWGIGRLWSGVFRFCMFCEWKVAQFNGVVKWSPDHGHANIGIAWNCCVFLSPKILVIYEWQQKMDSLHSVHFMEALQYLGLSSCEVKLFCESGPRVDSPSHPCYRVRRHGCVVSLGSKQGWSGSSLKRLLTSFPCPYLAAGVLLGLQ